MLLVLPFRRASCSADATSPRPSQVSNFTVTTTEIVSLIELQLGLEWSPPEVDNGVLTGYKICVSPVPLEPLQEPDASGGVQCQDVDVSQRTLQMVWQVFSTEGLYIQIRVSNTYVFSEWTDAIQLQIGSTSGPEITTSQPGVTTLRPEVPTLRPEVPTLRPEVTTSVMSVLSASLLLSIIILMTVITIMCYIKRNAKTIEVENIYDDIRHVPRSITADEAEFDGSRTENCYESVDNEFDLSSDHATYEIMHIYDVNRHSQAMEYNSVQSTQLITGSTSSNVVDGFGEAGTSKLTSRNEVIKFMPHSKNCSHTYANESYSQLVNSHQTYKRVSNVSIAKLVADSNGVPEDFAHLIPDSNDTYERAPNVNIARLIADSSDTYERVPNVDFARLIADSNDTYERVPNVDFAQLIADSNDTYERVPNVDFAQLIADSNDTYERVPNVDIARLIADSNYTYEQVPIVDIALLVATDSNETYERVPNVDIAQLVATDPNDTYERVPNLDIVQLVATEATSSKKSILFADRAEENHSAYDQVPHVDIFQILASYRTEIKHISEKTPTSSGGEQQDQTYANAVAIMPFSCTSDYKCSENQLCEESIC